MEEIWQKQTGKSGQFTTYDINKKTKVVLIQPNTKAIIVDHEGCGIINRLWVTFPGWFWQHWNTKFPVDQTILKRLIIRIYWDNEKFPSVECPAGDFFGMGHCIYKHYTSKYLAMSSGGFTSYFPMPFKKRVRIEIENLHDSLPVDVFLNANYTEYDAINDARYFHCQYMQGTSNGYDKIMLLSTEGSGHYSGCALSMQGKEKSKMFYLEAPEFFYIDGEEKPSIYGTGLEDYFNGGWYFREGEFCAELYGVPFKDTLNSMISMYRFHEQDSINFTKSIKLEFENPITWLELGEFKYSSTAYFYMDTPTKLYKELPAVHSLLDIYRTKDLDHISIP